MAPRMRAVASLFDGGDSTSTTGECQSLVDPSANVCSAVRCTSPVESGTVPANWNSARPPGWTLPPCHESETTPPAWSRTTCVVNPGVAAAPSITRSDGTVSRTPVSGCWDSFGDLTVSSTSAPGVAVSGDSSTCAYALAGSASARMAATLMARRTIGDLLTVVETGQAISG